MQQDRATVDSSFPLHRRLERERMEDCSYVILKIGLLSGTEHDFCAHELTPCSVQLKTICKQLSLRMGVRPFWSFRVMIWGILYYEYNKDLPALHYCNPFLIAHAMVETLSIQHHLHLVQAQFFFGTYAQASKFYVKPKTLNQFQPSTTSS